MKKTLIASAIAAATFSGAAFAQDATLSASELAARMDSMPTVYGNIQLAFVHDNYDGGTSDSELADNGSTIGVAHEHEIAPGVTGFFKAELEFDADQKAGNGGLNAFDEAYFGVKGDRFGQVWIGSDDSTYETAIDEIFNFYEYGTGVGGSYSTGEGDSIQYLSPSFAGLTLGAEVQISGAGTAEDANGNDVNYGKSYPYQLAAMYTAGGLELAFAMDSNDGKTAYSSNDELDVNNENTYGVRASYNLDNLRLTASYQTRKDVYDTAGVMAIYTLGSNQFAASYQNVDSDVADAQGDVIALQALHNLSDNMYVYVEGYFYGGDEVYAYDENGTSGVTDQRTIGVVGATYYF
ncbi:porin [Marinobacter sp. C2H3]|uniref:porin n=1 Tax=Marinobacter sp. C2H3 TaxID=3119003 RepID=UPI00300F4FE4